MPQEGSSVFSLFSLIKLHLASLPLASSYSRVAVSSVFCAQNIYFSAQTREAPLKDPIKQTNSLLNYCVISRLMFSLSLFAPAVRFGITSRTQTSIPMMIVSPLSLGLSRPEPVLIHEIFAAIPFSTTCCVLNEVLGSQPKHNATTE